MCDAIFTLLGKQVPVGLSVGSTVILAIVVLIGVMAYIFLMEYGRGYFHAKGEQRAEQERQSLRFPNIIPNSAASSADMGN